MIVAINRVFIKEKFKSDFEAILKSKLQELSPGGGLENVLILKPLAGDDYLIMTFWKSREDFEAYIKSEKFKKIHRGDIPENWHSRENELRFYSVITHDIKNL